MRHGIRTFIVTASALASLSAAARPTQAANAGVKAFKGARLWDGTGRAVVPNAVLVVEDGRVTAAGPAAEVAVPPGAPVVDLGGRFVIPGLVNAHGHVGETRGLKSGPELYDRENVIAQLRLYARYGVTTVNSLGGDQEAGFRARDEQDTSALDRARLYAAGRIVDAKTPDEARALGAAPAPARPDWVKIRVDDNLGTAPKMPPAVYRAVIDAAHERGLRVAAHLFYLEDARDLVAAGVDFIAHSIRDRDLDEGLVAELERRKLCVCPTLMREVSTFVYASVPDFFADPFFRKAADPAVLAALQEPDRQKAVRESPASARYRGALEIAKRNLKRLVDAGVPIAMGTDTGPPARFQGYFEHLELERMAEAGLTPQQTLLAATSGAAACLGLTGKVGSLVPGAWADFLVLKEDPLGDVRRTRTLETAWIAGNRVSDP
jgi:imidazolonepropionase-like amidohydrolase